MREPTRARKYWKTSKTQDCRAHVLTHDNLEHVLNSQRCCFNALTEKKGSPKIRRMSAALRGTWCAKPAPFPQKILVDPHQLWEGVNSACSCLSWYSKSEILKPTSQWQNEGFYNPDHINKKEYVASEGKQSKSQTLRWKINTHTLRQQIYRKYQIPNHKSLLKEPDSRAPGEPRTDDIRHYSLRDRADKISITQRQHEGKPYTLAKHGSS